MESPLSRIVVLTGILFLSIPLTGQEIQVKGVDWLKQVSSPITSPTIRQRPVKLSYHLTWKRKIKAGSMDVVIDRAPKDPTLLVGIAKGRTTGVAGKLFPYQFSSNSVLHAESIRPVQFEINEEMRSKKSLQRQLFIDKKVVSLKKTTNKKTNESREKTKNFHFEENLSHDIFSSLLFVRNLQLKTDDEATLIVTAFDHPFLIKFKVLGREPRVLKRKKYNTIKLDVTMVKINDDLTLKPIDKLKGATVWLIDDQDRLPLELQVDLFIGHISAYLSAKKFF